MNKIERYLHIITEISQLVADAPTHPYQIDIYDVPEAEAELKSMGSFMTRRRKDKVFEGRLYINIEDALVQKTYQSLFYERFKEIYDAQFLTHFDTTIVLVTLHELGHYDFYVRMGDYDTIGKVKAMSKSSRFQVESIFTEEYLREAYTEDRIDLRYAMNFLEVQADLFAHRKFYPLLDNIREIIETWSAE